MRYIEPVSSQANKLYLVFIHGVSYNDAVDTFLCIMLKYLRNG